MKYFNFCHAARVRLASSFAAVICVIGLISSVTAIARPTQPSAADRQITLAVSMLMERQHLSQQALNDTISQRCLETFIKELDPLKLFFYQSDVDEFMQNRTHLDDLIRRGDIQFAYNVFARFLSRVNERIIMAHGPIG